jgi:hypothetical protein
MKISLHLYTPTHAAIDCEDCDRKIANLKTDTDLEELFKKFESHKQTCHARCRDCGGGLLGEKHEPWCMEL